MKHIMYLTLTASLLFSELALAAGPPSFAGYEVPGYVTIGTNRDYMRGSYNVRMNPKPGHEPSYINVYHYANQSVYFSGYDAVANRYFSCYVPTSSAIYSQAVDMANNGGDSSFYGAYRDLASADPNECKRVYLLKSSYLTH